MNTYFYPRLLYDIFSYIIEYKFCQKGVKALLYVIDIYADNFLACVLITGKSSFFRSSICQSKHTICSQTEGKIGLHEKAYQIFSIIYPAEVRNSLFISDTLIARVGILNSCRVSLGQVQDLSLRHKHFASLFLLLRSWMIVACLQDVF
jgi:hypothetical protein